MEIGFFLLSLNAWFIDYSAVENYKEENAFYCFIYMLFKVNVLIVW